MNYDVAIVGAGPAGSTAALLLSKKGYNVILIEKDKFPRDKPCGGGLTKRLLNEFKFVNNLSIIESYSYGGILHSPSLRYEIEVKRDDPLVGMVSRKKFDFKLAKLAVEEGTILKDNKEVVDVKILKDNVKIFLDDGDIIKSKILIGADGVWSLIAKKTGLRKDSIDYAICIVEEFKVTNDTLDKFFGKSRLCHIYSQLQKIDGYAWIFPKKEHLNIGIGEFINKNKKQYKHNLSELFKDYIKVLKRDNIIPSSIVVKNYKGGSIPIIPLEKTYSDRVVLVGDAAGFANASTGEGIYYAMKSSKIAAEVIDQALKSGNTNKDFLSKYHSIWTKDFGKDLKLLYENRKNQDQLNDNFLKIVASDKILTDLILELGLGSKSLNECKLKLYIRFLYVSIKYRMKQFVK